MLNILEYALVGLARRWRRNIGLVIIYTLVVAFFASVILFTGSLKREAVHVLNDLPELWVQQLAGGRLEPIRSTKIDTIAGLRGVKKVFPRIWGYYYDSPSGAVFTIIGSDTLLNGLKFQTGEINGKLDSASALCGSGFIETHFVEDGDRLGLIDHSGGLRSYRIAGVFSSDSDLLTRDLIIVSEQQARKIIGLKKGYFTDLGITVINQDEVPMIATKIDRAFPSIRVVTSAQIRATYETLFSYRGGLFVFGAMISLFAFLILAWDRAAGLSKEARQELGILKGIGWQINDVLWLKFWEGIIISGSATLAGIILAWLHVFLFNAPLLRPFLIGWSVMYPSFDLMPVIELSSILIIIILSVIPYLAATIIPAWRGAITDPAEVMQNG